MNVFDTNGDRKVDKQEFYWGLKDLGCTISKRESGILLEALDTNADGFVNYDYFLVQLRGMPNETRQAVIDQAFAKFDKLACGVIDAADLGVVYDCSNHPNVRSGVKT